MKWLKYLPILVLGCSSNPPPKPPPVPDCSYIERERSRLSAVIYEAKIAAHQLKEAVYTLDTVGVFVVDKGHTEMHVTEADSINYAEGEVIIYFRGKVRGFNNPTPKVEEQLEKLINLLQ